jgi:hypothetical protein
MEHLSGNEKPKYEVFISHASEDKDLFVRPLVDELDRLGITVFYDERAISAGDSLRQKIDEGLATAKYSVVVLSSLFFTKSWAIGELNALINLQMQGKTFIIPVWHNITKEEVSQHSPLIADKLSLPTTAGVASIAAKIFDVIRNSPALPKMPSPLTKAAAKSPATHKPGCYQVELGRRHRLLRENVLEINLRQMATFYGFERVAELEAYERGDDELPADAIQRLREFFFVSREYLEDGSKFVFDSFDNICRDTQCQELIEQGFDSYLLCLNEERHNLWAWPVLHKEEKGFDRIIRAQDSGYFASMGGGKNNIMHMIKAVQMKGGDAYDVQVQLVDRKVWNSLKTGTFYRKGMYPFRGPDDEAHDRFLVWFEECLKKPNRW